MGAVRHVGFLLLCCRRLMRQTVEGLGIYFNGTVYTGVLELQFSSGHALRKSSQASPIVSLGRRQRVLKAAVNHGDASTPAHRGYL